MYRVADLAKLGDCAWRTAKITELETVISARDQHRPDIVSAAGSAQRWGMSQADRQQGHAQNMLRVTLQQIVLNHQFELFEIENQGQQMHEAMRDVWTQLSLAKRTMFVSNRRSIDNHYGNILRSVHEVTRSERAFGTRILAVVSRYFDNMNANSGIEQKAWQRKLFEQYDAKVDRLIEEFVDHDCDKAGCKEPQKMALLQTASERLHKVFKHAVLPRDKRDEDFAGKLEEHLQDLAKTVAQMTLDTDEDLVDRTLVEDVPGV